MHVTDSRHPALTSQLITNLVSEVTIYSPESWSNPSEKYRGTIERQLYSEQTWPF